MTVWQMYWLVKLDSICSMLQFASILGGMGLLFGWIGYVVDYEDGLIFTPALKKLVRRATWVFIPLVVFTTLLPDTKQLAAIILVPKLVNSEVVQRDIPQVYDLAVDWMKAKLAVPEAKVEE